MLSLLLMAVMAVVGGDGPGGATTAAAKTESKLRGYHEYNRAIDELLRAETRAGDQHERAEAIRRLAALYRELLHDPRLPASDTLKGYKAKLWTRLTNVQKDLQRQLHREAKLAPGQQADLQALQQATQSLAEQMSLMNYTLGGPGYVLEQTGGAFGGGAVDNADQLIRLIQHTIKPDSWDVAGGPGTMFYYRPLMALVVRATSEVHTDVGGLIEALRRAGQ